MSAGFVGQLVGGVLIMMLLGYLLALVFCRLAGLNELTSLALGNMIAPVIGGVAYTYGAFDGDFTHFPTAFVIYASAALFSLGISIIFEWDERLSKSKKSRSS